MVNKINTTKPTASKKKAKTNKRVTRRSQVRTPMPRRGILAGYGSSVTSTFSINRGTDNCVVSGYDLISYPATEFFAISYFMPINPIGWAGTRVAAIAAGYQNYRPLRIVIHYRPQVGSTDQKSLFIGTLWQNNTVNSFQSVEPTLLTSSGGVYVPSWQSVDTVVPCGNKLPQRLYPIRDPISPTTPFNIVCRSSTGGNTTQAVAMPGRIFIEYTFEFQNGVGVSQSYSEWNVNIGQDPTVTDGTRVPLLTGTVCDSQALDQLPLNANIAWDATYDGTSEIWRPRVNGIQKSFTSTFRRVIGHYGDTSI